MRRKKFLISLMFMRKFRRKKKTIVTSIVAVLLLSLMLFILFSLEAFLRKPSFISPIPSSFSNNYQKIASTSITQNLKILLAKRNIPFSSVSLSTDSSVLVTLASQEKIVFSSQKSLDSQISSLQVMLSRFTIEGKRFTVLDFRFDKPVIVFKQ